VDREPNHPHPNSHLHKCVNHRKSGTECVEKRGQTEQERRCGEEEKDQAPFMWPVLGSDGPGPEEHGVEHEEDAHHNRPGGLCEHEILAGADEVIGPHRESQREGDNRRDDHG